MILLSLILILMAFLWLEYKLFRSNISPLSCMLSATVIVIILYFLAQDILGFHHLTIRTLELIGLGSIAFFVGGLPFIYLLNKSDISCNNTVIEAKGIGYIDNITRVVSLISIVIMFAKLYTIGIANIGDEDAAAEFGAKGLTGHILVLQIFLLSYTLGTQKLKSIVNAGIVILLFVCILMYQVKIWLFAPVIVAVMIRKEVYKTKVSIIKYIGGIVAVFFVFILAYIPSLGFSWDSMTFFFNHFCKYIFAGIGGLNEAILLNLPIGGDPGNLLQPFINIIPIDRTPLVDAKYDYLIINDITLEYTNVYSLVGSAFIFGGYCVGTLYLIALGFLSYLLFYISKVSHNFWYFFGYLMWSLGLFFSFFANYYSLLNIYELTILCYLIGLSYEFQSKGILNSNESL